MKYLYVFILLIIGEFSFAQINFDSEIIAAHKIHELSVENGRCVYQFDSSGYLSKMILDENDIYKFNEIGQWVSLKKEYRIGDRKVIKQSLEFTYNVDGELESMIETLPSGSKSHCPIQVDSFIYRNTVQNGVRRITKQDIFTTCTNLNIDQKCNCYRSYYNERTELITQVNDSTYRVEYYTKKDNQEPNIVQSYHLNIIDTSEQIINIIHMKNNSDTILSSCNNCIQIEPNIYNCDCIDQFNNASSGNLILRKVFTSKEEQYSNLPLSSSTNERISYCLYPWKVYKISKKVFGKHSVSVTYY